MFCSAEECPQGLPCVERRRGIPDAVSVDDTKGVKHMKGFLAVTLHVGNVECMGKNVRNNAVFLSCKSVIMEESNAKFLPH